MPKISLGVLDEDHLLLKNLSSLKAKNWAMYGRFNLEVIFKTVKETKRTYDFHELLNKELHCGIDQKHKI